MNSYERFNHLMVQFLEDLVEVFPEDSDIQASIDTFDDVVSINYKKPRDLFRTTFVPSAQLIADRNPAVFDITSGGVDLKRLWTSNISDSTREAIWDYMTRLLILCA